MREEKEIEQVANALSELLRSVLTNKNEMITLWEEREYIENYMVIENFKYRNEYTLPVSYTHLDVYKRQVFLNKKFS